jgi:hypothetical protein
MTVLTQVHHEKLVFSIKFNVLSANVCMMYPISEVGGKNKMNYVYNIMPEMNSTQTVR